MVGNERHDPGRNASRADVHEPRRSAIDLSMIFLISPWTCVVGRPSPTRVADRRRAEWETVGWRCGACRVLAGLGAVPQKSLTDD